MWPLVEARNYHHGRLRPVRFIGIHDMEALAGPDTAENVTKWMAGPDAPMASAHVFQDTNSTVQGVRAADTAFAIPGANADGFHIELAGFARNRRDLWLAPPNDPVLTWGACVAAEAVITFRRFGVPLEVRRLDVDEIGRRSAFGFIGHVDATRAFNTPGGHTDPGDNFPWDVFLGRVQWWIGQLDHPTFKPDFR